MKHRSYALLLAAALSLSLLAGCGPKEASDSSQSSGSSLSSSQGSQSASSSGSDGSTSSSGSGSDVSASASGSAVAPDASQEETQQPQEQAKLTLNTTDFTLFAAGKTYTLKAQGLPSGTKVTFASGNEEVATVDENGKITAVAPGTAKITVTAGDQKATCVVRCKWEEEKPSNGGSTSGGSSSGSNGGATTPDPQPTKVDLAAFYSSVASKYAMPNLTLADSALMDNYYPGLSAVAAEQCQVYVNMMSMNMGEIALVQVKNSGDVAKVKSIFQARIDSMVNGGAWYPEPTRIWSEQSRVVSNGSYVMLVVGEDCDAIVSEFNALF